jgi:hemolysin III
MIVDWEKPYTPGEETANTVIHAIGSHLGAAMLAILCYAAYLSGTDVAWKIVSSCIFGFSVVLLYAISSAYHAVTYRPAKDVLNVMDHMAIYFLIAGTYTPFCLQTLRASGNAAMGWTIFGIEWAAVIAGVVFKIRNTGKFRYLSTAAYIVMGWVVIIAIVPVARELGGLGTMWLAVGGGLYTVGTVFYLWKGLPYHHPVWHLFVLAGTICHFFCILWHVVGR